MRLLTFASAVSIAAVTSAATPALADGGAPSLTANARASVVGGGGGTFDDKTLQGASTGSVLSSATSNTLPSGAYADAQASASFGLLRAYADGYVPLSPAQEFGNAQATGFAQFYDYVAGADVSGGLYNLTLSVDGLHTDTTGLISISAFANLYWALKDTTTNQDIAYGNWTSTNAASGTLIVDPFMATAGHGLELRVDFDADTYTTNNSPGPGGSGYGAYPVVADYYNTVHVYVDPFAGGSVIGASGHDYATPLAAGVPEPAAWALMLTGFVLAGTGLRYARRIGSAA